jgi:hypothetical protein
MRTKPRPSISSSSALELGRQRVEGEVLAAQLEGIGALGLGHRQRGVELVVVGLAEAQRPRLGVGDVGRPPLAGGLELAQALGPHHPLRGSSAAPDSARTPGLALGA